MKRNPKVTVLIPVYNGEKYLKECLDSVRNQTFTDFECLVIDDGSTDGSMDLVASYFDSRIRLLANEVNMGGASTRNKGFDLACGEYVVFMDCDDISVPCRIEKQVAFMDAHPEVGICGSFMQAMNSAGTIEDAVWRCPLDHESIARYLAVDCTLFNPTLITRRSVVTGHAVYHNPVYTASDDMDWYIRMARVTRLANLPEVLTFYRRHEQQETSLRRFMSRRNTINLHLGLMLEEIKRFRPDVAGQVEPVSAEMTDLVFLKNLVLIDQLIASWPAPPAEVAEAHQVHSALKKHLNLMWWDVAACLPRYSAPIFRVVRHSAFFKSLPLMTRWRVWFKSMVGREPALPGWVGTFVESLRRAFGR